MKIVKKNRSRKVIMDLLKRFIKRIMEKGKVMDDTTVSRNKYAIICIASNWNLTTKQIAVKIEVTINIDVF